MSPTWRRIGPLLVAVGFLGAAPARNPGGTITVFAAASLTESFRDIDLAFARQNPGITVRFNFAGSQQLAAQLEQGARADVFASADERWMIFAREHALLAGEPATFARNRLIVIVPRSNPAGLTRLEDLARPGLKLVLAAEAVPAGKYSREMLRNLGQTAGYPSGFPDRVLANLVSSEETVKGVVTKVQLGEADAGVVYRTDVTPALSRRVTVMEIPEGQNVVASYPVATLRPATNRDAGRRFVGFLLSVEGQGIMQQHGFLPVAPVP